MLNINQATAVLIILCYSIFANGQAVTDKPIQNIPPDFGNIQYYEPSRCADLTGEFELYAINSFSTARYKELSLPSMSLDSLLELQSHTWPIKYPLLDEMTVIINQEDSSPNTKLRIQFNVENRPFVQDVNISECIKGWTNIKISGKTYSEGGVITYSRNLYIITNDMGNLIAQSHSEDKTTFLFIPFGPIRKEIYWYLFKRVK